MFAKEAPGYIDCCRHATAYVINFVWHMHFIKYCDYAKLGRSLRTRDRHKAILIYKLWNYKSIFQKHIAQRAHIAGKLFLFITNLFNKSNFCYMFRIFTFFSLKHKTDTYLFWSTGEPEILHAVLFLMVTYCGHPSNFLCDVIDNCITNITRVMKPNRKCKDYVYGRC